MEKRIEEIEKWLDNLTEFSLPSWNDLPEMELYMDQVMSYLQKKLEPVIDEDIEKIITPYMVNNYVKANLIDAPKHKKYSKSQIGYLLGICFVKQVLSIGDILYLYNLNKDMAKEKDELYKFFKDVQDEAIKNESEYISKRFSIVQRRLTEQLKRASDDKEKKDAESFAKANLSLIAFRLAIEADIKKLIADHILSSIKKDGKNKRVVKKEKKIAKKVTKIDAKKEAKAIKIVRKK